MPTDNFYIKNPKTGCWESQLGGRHYTQKWVNGCFILTHRYMYQKYKGIIPKGMQIDHLCQNKICCNPEHLELVTPKENTRRAFTTKLKLEDVKLIHIFYRGIGFTQKEIAKIFKINQSEVSRVVNGLRWNLGI